MMARSKLSLITAITAALAACGDDGGTIDDAGADSTAADTGVSADAGDADASAPDSAVMDTGPDPRCPGPTCPTTIIALDGFEIGMPCALRRDGELFCVDAPTSGAPSFVPAGTFIGGMEIARGATETCILHDAHIVTCFRPGMAPFEVAELYDALDIDTWAAHTCVVRPDRVTCWGDNGTGQIEPGGSATYPTMHDVPGVTTAARIATSAAATCALLRDGTVVCWGDDFGSTPTPIAAVTEGAEISAGEDHFCVTTTTGGVQCFGDADAGTEATAPDGLSEIAETAAFHGETCVRSTSGQVSCWGVPGMTGQTATPPLELIVGLDDALLLSNHCALRSTGVVSCWSDRDAVVDATGL